MNINESRGAVPARTSEPSRKLLRWLGAGWYPTLSRWIDPSRQYSQLTYAPLLAKLVRNDVAWLDVGCGHKVFKLNSPREELEIVARSKLAVGCDRSFQALRIHRSIRTRVCADVTCLPFANEAFDVVSLNYVAEHLQEPEKTFAELARLLRPNGALVLVTPNSRGYFVRITRLGSKFVPESLVQKFILLREFRSSENVFPTYYRANTRDDLARLIEQAGLREVNFQMLNDPALFSFIAPLAVLELLVGRLLSLFRLNDLKAGTIIGVYCRIRLQLGSSRQQLDETVEGALLSSPDEAVR